MKPINKGSKWGWLKSFFKAHTSLIVIIFAILLLEFTTGVIYYSSQDIIQHTTIQAMERENNALYLCIRNKLAEVEVVLDNMSWIVSDDMMQPDSLFRATYQIVENNPMILGSCVACIPHLFPEHGYWFEPYSVRRSNGTIDTMQLGSASHDYTKSEFFAVPLATGKSHWCEPYLENDGAKAFITTYGVPVRNGKGEIVAVVDADLSLDWLKDVIYEDIAYPSNQRYLITGRYNLLAGEDNLVLRTTIEQLKDDADKKGYIIVKDEKGSKKHVFYTPVGGKTDWILVNVLDDSDVFGKLRRVRRNLLLMLMAGLIPIGYIVWRTKRNLERLRQVNAEKERINSELRVASQIQQRMLPHFCLQRDDVDILGSLVPAREVGGDLFDYFIRDEKLFFCIGDVSGKGTPSAMLMAGTRSFFRAFSAHDNNPARIMHRINEAACLGNETNMFATLFIGVLDLPSGHLRYCDAGHDKPIVVSDTGLQTLDCNPHLPVGVFNDVKYNVQDTFLTTGTTLFLYTDGLTEAMNANRKQFGLKRIEDVLKNCIEGRLSPKDILDIMTKEVHSFVQDAEQSDDRTLLAIRYTPKLFKSIHDETLILKNHVAEVSKLSSFQKALFEKIGIEKSLSRQIRLAVEEAVVNVIDYAYSAGVEGNIEVRMMTDGQDLRIVIVDSGVPFDPTLKNEIDVSLSVEERQVGGLGIHLLRKIMDSINYEYIDGHNILTLVKKLN
jgi:sigma-B regulation protein RsbU (phosphoserine phosphatase)